MLTRRELLWTCAGGALATFGVACKRAREVTVYTSVDRVFSDPIFRAFERQSGVKVRAVFDTEEAKSAGVQSRLLAEAKRPQADVFWSGDPVRPFVLIKRGLALPYVPNGSSDLPPAFRASDGTWTGSAARARVLLVNTRRLDQERAPSSIRDLVDARFRGRVAIANPLFGTTTAHVAALSSVWGREKTRAFFADLRTNGARVASSNGEVKRLVAAGDVTLGVVDTDDAEEALHEKAPVAIVYPDQGELGTLIMPTSVILIRGGPRPEEAKRLVDYLVSAEVEALLCKAAGHMPLRRTAVAPAGVRRVSDLRTMSVDLAKVATEMEANQSWLREWVGL